MASNAKRPGRPPTENPGPPSGASGFPDFEHNQWTVEGEIERFGAFGQGIANARGWKRWAGKTIVLLILSMMALPAVVWAIGLVGQ